MTPRVFVIPFLALCFSQLSLQLMNGHINAPVGVFTRFGSHKNLAVLCPGNDLNTRASSLGAVDDHFDLIDAIVVFRKLGCFLLSMCLDRFRYFDMFAANCKKQNRSP